MTVLNALLIARAFRTRTGCGRILLTARQADAFVWLGPVALNWPLLALLRPGATFGDLLVPGLMLAGASALSILRITSELCWPDGRNHGTALFVAGILSIFAVTAAVVGERAVDELRGGLDPERIVGAGQPDWSRAGKGEVTGYDPPTLKAEREITCVAPLAGRDGGPEVWFVLRRTIDDGAAGETCSGLGAGPSSSLRILRADELDAGMVQALDDARGRYRLATERPVVFVADRGRFGAAIKLSVATATMALFNLTYFLLVGFGRKREAPR